MCSKIIIQLRCSVIVIPDVSKILQCFGGVGGTYVYMTFHHLIEKLSSRAQKPQRMNYGHHMGLKPHIYLAALEPFLERCQYGLACKIQI
jgi:hypothetical protein